MNTARKAHFLFISYYFPPMGGGGVQRILKFLKYWDYQQYDVSVLTVKSSHFYSEDKSLLRDLPANPAVYRTGTLDPFRLFYLLKKMFRFLQAGQRRKARESNAFLRTLANLFFLPDSRIFWLPFAVLKIRQIHRARPVDLVVASMPPFTPGIIAHLTHKWLGLPCILDFRDAWTQNPYLPSVSRFHDKFQELLERRTIRESQAFVFVNPNLREYYRRKYDWITNENSTVVRNGYDPEDFTSAEIRSELKSSSFRIGIMGTVYSHGNAPLHLLEALKLLWNQNPPSARKIQLVFIGKWTAEFIGRVQAYHFQRQVQFVDYLPHRDALACAGGLDAMALAVHSDKKGSENVTPGRIYEYLYLRKPVLAMCPEGSDLAEIVRTCRAGETIDYADVQGIAAILEKWVTAPEHPACTYAFHNIEQFDRRKLTRKMILFIENNLGMKSGGL